MSTGPEKKEDIQTITVTTDEFSDICQRLHMFLLDRAEKAKRKRDKQGTEKSAEEHVEKAKDVFVFVHMMELIESMTEEIMELRSITESFTAEMEEEELGLPEMYTSPKKKFVN